VVAIQTPRAAVEHLQLSRAVAVSRAGFYTAYADQLRLAISPGSVQSEETSVWRNLLPDARPWAAWGTLATTYRLAAQFTFLFDPSAAVPLFQEAGQAYREAGSPFGLFLLAASQSANEAAELLFARGHADAITGGTEQVSNFSRAALEDPAQRCYLLLAYAGHPLVRRELREPLRRFQQTLEGHSLHPIGPQSQPLALYLACSHVLMDEDDRSASSSVGDLVSALGVLGRDQAAALRAGMRNKYLWDRGAAPLNYVDLELTALTALCMRGSENQRTLREGLADVAQDPLADLNVWAGAETLTVTNRYLNLERDRDNDLDLDF
jgi:hypothetical protein